MWKKLILRQKLRTLFPDTHERQEVEQALARYGADSSEWDVVRVRLAVLKLAGADVKALHSLVDAAKEDYRDVLAWAESPSWMRPDFWDLPRAEKNALAQRDRDHYKDWLRE